MALTAQRARPFLDDLAAGVTVALVAVPQSIAFAAIARLPAEAGLWSAIVMAIVGSAFAGSAKLNIGPNVTFCSMLLGILLALEPGGMTASPALASLLALEVGVLVFAAVMLRIDRVVRFVSRAVLAGFTTGAALLIVTTQVGSFLGTASTRSATVGGALLRVAEELPRVRSPWPMSFGAGTILVIVALKRLGPRFPAPLLAVGIGSVGSWLLARFGGVPLETIGVVRGHVPGLALPPMSRALEGDVILAAMTIAMVGIVQTLGIASVLAKRGERLEGGRDLVGVGAANVAAAMVGGFPGAGSFARSALNEQAGARTRGSGLVAGIVTLLVVLIAAPFAGHIPLAVIAGLLVVTALQIPDLGELRRILVRGGDDRAALVATTVAVFVIPIHWAMLVGLAVSVALFLERASRLHVAELVPADGGFEEHALRESTGAAPITILQLEGPLFFAHSTELADALARVLARGPRVVVLRMRRVRRIDFSVLAALERAAHSYLDGGGHVLVCGLSPALREDLAASELGRRIGEEGLLAGAPELWSSVREAIERAEGLVARR